MTWALFGVGFLFVFHEPPPRWMDLAGCALMVIATVLHIWAYGWRP